MKSLRDQIKNIENPEFKTLGSKSCPFDVEISDTCLITFDKERLHISRISWDLLEESLERLITDGELTRIKIKEITGKSARCSSRIAGILAKIPGVKPAKGSKVITLLYKDQKSQH